MRRKHNLSKLSAQVIDYLVDRRNVTQSDIAVMIEVDKSFISRVRSGDRELSPTQMSRIAEHLNVPLGVLLIDVTETDTPVSPSRRKLLDLCSQLMRQADEALALLKSESKASSPSRMR